MAQNDDIWLKFCCQDHVLIVLSLCSWQVMYNAVLENGCSELGARMSAMDSSSRNAGEMLDRLTLTYNRSVPPPFFPSDLQCMGTLI
jgi:hypothetical protein